MAADKRDEWIAKFKGGEDPQGKYVHYPNWKPGSSDGSSATGAFGYLKKGHLKTAWSSKHFADIRKQYGNNYNKFWKAVRSDKYGSETTTARDRAYAGWLIEKSGGDIDKAAKFNLTGNTKGTWANKKDAANNMNPQSYANKISGTKYAGNAGTGAYVEPQSVNMADPKLRKLGRKYNNPFNGGRLDGKAIINRPQIPISTNTKVATNKPGGTPYEEVALPAGFKSSMTPTFENAPAAPKRETVKVAGPSRKPITEEDVYHAYVDNGEVEDTYTPPKYGIKKGTRNDLDFKQRMSPLDKVLPFVPNVATAVQTPPAVPNPHLDTPIALERVNMDNDRNEVRRAARGANLSLDQTLDANTAAAAKSNVLAQKFAQESKVNQAERNQNIQISNKEKITNAGIAQNNTAKLNQNLVDNLDRDMTQQSEQMMNLYDVGNKIANMRAFDADASADARRINMYDKVDYTGSTNRMLSKIFPKKDKKRYGGAVARIAARKLNYKPIM